MLTKKEQELVNYWKNWRPGKKEFKPNKLEEEPTKVEVKVDINMDNLAEDIIDRMWDII